MKKSSNTLFARLGENEVNKLATIVEETIALDVHPAPPKKTFTAAEMWNIQRQRKSPVQRRFIF